MQNRRSRLSSPPTPRELRVDGVRALGEPEHEVNEIVRHDVDEDDPAAVDVEALDGDGELEPADRRTNRPGLCHRFAAVVEAVPPARLRTRMRTRSPSAYASVVSTRRSPLAPLARGPLLRDGTRVASTPRG